MATFTIKAWINVKAETLEEAQFALDDFERAVNADAQMDVADDPGPAISISTKGELKLLDHENMWIAEEIAGEVGNRWSGYDLFALEQEAREHAALMVATDGPKAPDLRVYVAPVRLCEEGDEGVAGHDEEHGSYFALTGPPEWVHGQPREGDI